MKNSSIFLTFQVIKFYDLNVVSVTSDSASNVIKAVANMKLPRF